MLAGSLRNLAIARLRSNLGFITPEGEFTSGATPEYIQ